LHEWNRYSDIKVNDVVVKSSKAKIRAFTSHILSEAIFLSTKEMAMLSLMFDIPYDNSDAVFHFIKEYNFGF